MVSKDPRRAQIEATDDLANRMLRSLQASGLSVGQMAQWLECNRNSIGNWLNRRAKPFPATLKLWAQITDVPYEWLRTGKWPKRPAPASPQVNQRLSNADQVGNA